MKKLTAFFFLTLFLFNIFGYRLVIEFMQQKANIQLDAKIDNNAFDESQLVELKVPMHLPYQTNWSSYERYNGEIEIDGISYKYVKRKVADDTLFLMCIPNTNKMHLETAKIDFFKVSNDLAQNNTSKKSGESKTLSFKNLQGEYDEYSFSLSEIYTLNTCLKNWLPVQSKYLLTSPHISPEQPPDVKKA